MKSATFLLALALCITGVTVADAQKKPAPPKPKPKPPVAKPVSKVTLEVLSGVGDTQKVVTDGAVLSGDVSFRVRVNATEPVISVEFTVGSDLRDTDSSVPYEFKWDALAEEEGPITLTFKAYTASGANATKVLKVRVDNGSSLGAEALTKRGNEEFNAGRYDEAITSGRMLLKVDPKSLPGNLLLARTYLIRNSFDRAQKYAEDAVSLDANNVEELLAQVGVRRALQTLNRSGTERSETEKIIRESLLGAVDARQKANNVRFERVATSTDLVAFADAALASGREGAVIDRLSAPFQADLSQTAVGNRLAYAYLVRGERLRARDTVALIRRSGKADAYTYALSGIVAGEFGDDKAADEFFRNGLLENPESLGIRTAQASLALKRNRISELRNISNGLSKDVDSRPEASFFTMAVANRLGAFDVARKGFEAAIRVDPANAEVYIERGNQSVQTALSPTSDAKEREASILNAETMYSAALRARPNSGPALIGLSLVENLRGKAVESVRFAESAARAEPNSAAAQYALAGALTLRDKAIAAALADPATKNAPELRALQRETLSAVQAALRAGAANDARVRDLPVPKAAE
ncbi:MAG: hypothetical protein C4320_07240, partial [Armatimonadota bacterium]